MLKPIVLIAIASLLIAATAPTMPPPRYDIFDLEEGEAAPAAVGKPLTVRLWTGFADSEWRLVPQAGVVLLESSRFLLAPDPDGGVGFSSGDDITLKVTRPGRYRIVFQYIKKATGQPDRTYSNKPFDVIAR